MKPHNATVTSDRAPGQVVSTLRVFPYVLELRSSGGLEPQAALSPRPNGNSFFPACVSHSQESPKALPFVP